MTFHWRILALLFSVCVLINSFAADLCAADKRPNIVLCIADDWGFPWASAYGD